MKKHLLLIAAFIISTSLTASFVPVEKAQKVAQNFYFEKCIQAERAITFDNVVVSNIFAEESNGQVYYYVFSFKDGGFVIVPAEDCLPPVLGYSLNNDFGFNNPPPNIEYWINQYVEQINFARDNLMEPAISTIQQWKQYQVIDPLELNTSTRNEGVEPLLTSLWNQGWPYNYYSPEDPQGPGGHAYAGCVATAYAQLLYYWRYPLHGTGYHCYIPEDHPEYGEQCADFENTWYRWNEMCDEPRTVNKAIAEFLYHVGVALEMNFGPDGSGASGYPEDIEEYFDISEEYDSISREYFTDTEWKNIMIDQLEQGFPMAYVGFEADTSVGHMWNCDGYQDTNYFHMNWGWGGSSNGYYTIDNLQGFNIIQYLGINFYPKPDQYPNCAEGADTLRMFEGSLCDGSGPLQGYRNNTRASWLIDPQNEMDSISSITLTFKRFELDEGDRLLVYDGADNSAPLLADLSGNDLPENLESTGNKAFLEFITDESATANGFHVDYFAKQPKWCTGMTQVSDSACYIEDGSGRFYYQNQSNCLWMIDPGLEGPLTLHFVYFDTELDHDILKIYDAESQELLAELSGNYETPPDPITSQSGKFLLGFISNKSERGKGWMVTYNTVGVEEPVEQMEVFVRPNPTSGKTDISYQSSVSSFQYDKVKLDIMNSHGMVINTIEPESGKSVPFDLSAFPAGMYFVRVQAGNKVLVKKVIKK